ncbi:hypothetical protein QFZ72_004159 [Bacillus sp. V2I10]|nr:hypothetical protein [Bacillus sp. V2I10]
MIKVIALVFLTSSNRRKVTKVFLEMDLLSMFQIRPISFLTKYSDYI